MNKKFIKASTEACTFNKHIPAPYLRKEFIIDFDADSAQLEICGLGFYHVYINGNKITKGELAPYISNPDDYCYYDTYDIKKHLNKGNNVIGIILGNGFQNPFGGAIWDFEKADWLAPPCVALECSISGEAKSVEFTADESFLCHPSPIYFDELRMGTYYDARNEISDWCMPGTCCCTWTNAIIADTPRGELKKCEAEPIAVSKRIQPIKITKSENGWLYDFGENNAGICELRIKGTNGQRVTLVHAELEKDGKLDYSNLIFDRPGFEYYFEYNQKDIYILKGDSEEVFTPPFTYHGFRYVYVEGITDEQATKDLLTYLVMSSDLKEAGGFFCSDETANTLCEMVKRSDISNFYYFTTDCPHREKNGWTGDAATSAEHIMLNYHAENSFKEWLNNIRKAQGEDGSLPGIIPTSGWGFEWGNGPAWDRVLFNLPYEIYRHRGNTDVIKENAHAMMSYIEYIMRRRSIDGTISVGLGDWLPTGMPGICSVTPLELTDSIMVMEIARKASVMFNAAQLELNAQYADKVYKTMRSTIRAKLIDKNLVARGDSISSQALCIFYGIYEKAEEQKAFDYLMKLLKDKNYSFDCGYLGLRVLFHVLSDFGEGELAYELITRKEFPSYGLLIEMGETTLPESLMPEGVSPGSHNHHFFGDISHWFSERVAGLKIVSPEKVLIKPDFIKRLNFANAWYELPKGKVSVAWKRTENGIKIEVSSPVEYDIILPDGYVEKEGFIIQAK